MIAVGGGKKGGKNYLLEHHPVCRVLCAILGDAGDIVTDRGAMRATYSVEHLNCLKMNLEIFPDDKVHFLFL